MHRYQGFTGRQEGTLSRGLDCVRAEGFLGIRGGARWLDSGVGAGSVAGEGVKPAEGGRGLWVFPAGSGDPLGGCNQGGPWIRR